MFCKKYQLALVAISTLICTVQQAHAEDREFVSYEIDASASLVSDVRTRGISDSLLKPGLKLSMEIAHETGLVAIAEAVTVSKKQFLDGNGLGLTLGAGYRFGDPDAWHFGVGVATEMFPGAEFKAPNSLDMALGGDEADFPETSYDSNFLLLEISYGALEGRILNVISDTYRGANTGGVCGSMLKYNTPPYSNQFEITQAQECYARGDNDSRGTLLYDLDYTIDLAPATKLKLHAGYQDVANFSEANFADYGIGLTHKQWGFEWGVDYVTTRTRARELYLAEDGDELRETDNDKLVLTVTRDF